MDRQKLVLVALADVPVETRRIHGHYLVKAAAENGRLAEAIELTKAIEQPAGSYWIPAHALDRVHTTL